MKMRCYCCIFVLQNNLVEKDFNIEVAADGVAKPVTEMYNATVTDNILEIRLYWAGKGTRRIPVSGVYGPLISAISVDPSKKFQPWYLLPWLKLEFFSVICKLFSFVSAYLLIWFFLADFKPRSSGGGKTKTVPIILGAVGFCLVFSALAIFWWKCCFRVKRKGRKGLGLLTPFFFFFFALDDFFHLLCVKTCYEYDLSIIAYDACLR